MSDTDTGPIVLTAEQIKRRKARSLAIALVLVSFIVIVYLVTVVKLGPGVLNRPI